MSQPNVAFEGMNAKDAVMCVVMDVEHFRDHIGTLFRFLHKTTLGNGATLKYSLVPSMECHLRMLSLESDSGKITVSLREAPTGLSGGTGITPRNTNRDFPNCDTTPGMVVKHGVTTTGDGTELDSNFIGGSSGGATRAGGGAQSTYETVLKAGVEYLVTVLNESGGTAAFLLKGIYYTSED